MKKNKAYKYRIYPDPLQKELLAKTFGCVRFIYNKILADKIDHYRLTKKSLSNTPAQYKDEYPFLKEVDSLALANAQLNLQSAYKNFFTKKSQYRPRSQRYHQHQIRRTADPWIYSLTDKRYRRNCGILKPVEIV